MIGRLLQLAAGVAFFYPIKTALSPRLQVAALIVLLAWGPFRFWTTLNWYQMMRGGPSVFS